MKEKSQKCTLNIQETKLLLDKLTNDRNVLENKLQDVIDKYIEAANKEEEKKRPNTKKLNKLLRKQLKLKTKIQRITIDIAHIENGTYQNLGIFQKIIKKVNNLSFKQQQMVGGYTLVLPWVIGLCLFFAVPILMTIYWSFNEVTNIAGGLSISWNGLNNYINLFTTQMLGTRTFLEVLTSSITEMLINVPVIFIFSLLVAVVLNTKFKGHQIFKAIFFIPVIYNTTVISLALTGSFGTTMDSNMQNFTGIVSNIQSFLLGMGFGEGIIKFLIASVDRIFIIVTKSGIQILIFIAALQAIPKNLYEAAKIEGATAYDCFCKITVPMAARMFLPVIIYSIVDCFATSDLIRIMTIDSTGAKISYGISSAIAIVYFIANLLIIGIIALSLRRVTNHD